MRAITVSPGIANSARLDEVPEPPHSDGAVLVRTLALGVCATDREILSGTYGSAPPGERHCRAAQTRRATSERFAGFASRTCSRTTSSASGPNLRPNNRSGTCTDAAFKDRFRSIPYLKTLFLTCPAKNEKSCV